MARILIIDDAPVYRNLCHAVLKGAGHEVEVAADGAEGVHRYRGQPTDLVLCDLFMPVQDGFQTVRELRTFSTVPIVVMDGRGSRYPGAKCFEDALQIGATRALQKPFVEADLLALVGELLQPTG